MWILNYMLLNNQCDKGKIKRNIKMKHQNLWDTTKAVLRGKFIMITLNIK